MKKIKLKKTGLAIAVTVCGLMVGTGSNALVINASEKVKTEQELNESSSKRRPEFMGSIGENVFGGEDIQYLDNGNVKGVTWNEEKNQLTLENFKGSGNLLLNFLNDYSKEESKKEKKKALKQNVEIVVKGNNVINGSIHSHSNLYIHGNGVLKVTGYDINSGNDLMWKEHSIIADNNLIIDGVTLDSVTMKADGNIKISNAKINSSFYAWLHNDDNGDYWFNKFIDGGDIEDKRNIEIDNSSICLNYLKPSKKVIKHGIKRSECIIGGSLKIKNSNIEFKGSKKALKYVSLFFGNETEIESGNVKYVNGMIVSVGSNDYRITKLGKKVSEVELIEGWTEKTAVVKKYIKIDGKKYRITSIGKKAFAKCKGIKNVVIKSKYIKKIGKKAFVTKNGNTITFKVPSANKKAYSKLIKKAGIKSYNVK